MLSLFLEQTYPFYKSAGSVVGKVDVFKTCIGTDSLLFSELLGSFDGFKTKKRKKYKKKSEILQKSFRILSILKLTKTS